MGSCNCQNEASSSQLFITNDMKNRYKQNNTPLPENMKYFKPYKPNINNSINNSNNLIINTSKCSTNYKNIIC